MGADMLLTVCLLPTQTFDGADPDRNDIPIPEGAREKVRDQFTERVARISPQLLREWLESVDPFSEDKDIVDDGVFTTTITEILWELFLDLCHCYNRRDCTIIRLEGRTYIATGGLSWGDEPTEAFNTVSDMSQLDMYLFKEPFVVI